MENPPERARCAECGRMFPLYRRLNSWVPTEPLRPHLRRVNRRALAESMAARFPRLLEDSWRRYLDRVARGDGRTTLARADMVCVALGKHIDEVYGDACASGGLHDSAAG